MGTLCAQLLLQFYADFLKLHRCFGHGLKMCMWFGHNPQIIFCHFFSNLNFFFHALLLSTYVDSMYVVRVTPPKFFFFIFRRFLISLKNLGGGHKFSEFACYFCRWNSTVYYPSRLMCSIITSSHNTKYSNLAL